MGEKVSTAADSGDKGKGERTLVLDLGITLLLRPLALAHARNTSSRSLLLSLSLRLLELALSASVLLLAGGELCSNRKRRQLRVRRSGRRRDALPETGCSSESLPLLRTKSATTPATSPFKASSCFFALLPSSPGDEAVSLWPLALTQTGATGEEDPRTRTSGVSRWRSSEGSRARGNSVGYAEDPGGGGEDFLTRGGGRFGGRGGGLSRPAVEPRRRGGMVACVCGSCEGKAVCQSSRATVG